MGGLSRQFAGGTGCDRRFARMAWQPFFFTSYLEIVIAGPAWGSADTVI